MKKTLLKVASIVMMLAMVLAAVVVPNETAKASDVTELVILLPETESRVAKVLLDLEWNGAGLVADGTADSSVGWGRDMYTFTKDASENVYTIELTGTVDAVNNSNLGASMQFLFIDDSGNMVEAVKFPLWDTKPDNVNAYKNNDALYFNVNVSGSATWAEVTALTEDPRAAKASDVIAVINEIGTVELSDTCKAKIEAARAAYNAYTGNAADITNYSKLTAAEEKWTELMEAGAGKLTLYVKNNANWEKVALYGWDGADLGTWPGTLLTADENNEGWLTITTTITQAANILLDNNDNGSQTIDWKYVTAGTYWITLAADNSFESSTTAPTGWETGEEESESESSTEKEEEEIDKKGDFSDAAIYMVVLMGAALVIVSAVAKKKMA